MMSFTELWSADDDARLSRFEGALATGALAPALLAIEGASATSRRSTLARLESWGEELARRCYGRSRGVEQAECMRVLLSHDLEFGGRRERRLDPRSCFLSEVLERRFGIPHLLSAVWMLVGQEAGLSVGSVALPLYAVVHVGEPPGHVYADPFCLGRRLKVADCKRIVRLLTDGDVSWDPAFLEPAPIKRLLDSVLHHLLACYEAEDDAVQLFQTMRFMAALHPDRGELRFALARACVNLGAYELARGFLTELTEHYPELAERAEGALSRLDAQPHVVH